MQTFSVRHLGRASLAALALLFSLHSALGSNIPIVNIDPSTQIPMDRDHQLPGQYQGFAEGHGDGMVGWSFDLLKTVTVTQVGWYDQDQDGLSRAFEIGLWKSGVDDQFLGDPLNGIFVPGGTAAALEGVWRVVDLPTPLTLTPGWYFLGGLDSADTTDVIKFADMYPAGYDPAVTGSRLTIDMFFYAGFGGPGFHKPTELYLEEGVELGPILFISVPEPSAIALWGIGAVCLFATRKRGRFSGA